MATKKTKQAAKPKKSTVSTNKTGVFARIWQFAKNNPALTILIIVLMGAVIYGSIYLFERWQFSTAEKKLDSVASAIVAELGEPTSIEKIKSCSYRSTVFEDQRGLPACSVSYYIEYSFNNNEEANMLRNQLTEELVGTSYTSLGMNNNQYDDNPLTYEAPIEFTHDNIALLTCSARIENYNDKNIRVYFGCVNNRTISKPYPVN